MGAVRTTTLPARAADLGNVTLTDASQGQLLGVLKDRQSLVLESYNTVFLSKDYGVTTTVAGAVNDGSWRPSAFVETPGGQVLYAVGKSGNASQLFRSTNWNGAAATNWVQVLAASGPGVEFRGEWGFNQRCIAPSWSRHAGAIFIAEYGTWIDAATTATQGARRVYMSTDDGLTWRTVFDVAARWPGENHLHVHATAYDPWTGRLVVSQGDGGVNGSPGHSGVWYSDNIEAATPTWTLVAGSATTTGAQQVTAIIPVETGIILLPDGPPSGVRLVPRRGLSAYGPIRQAATITGYNEGYIGHTGYRAGGFDSPLPGAPILLSVQQPTPPLANSGFPTLLVSTDGLNFRQLYRHGTAVSNSAPGFTHVFGPTVDGKIVALLNITGAGRMFIADYLPRV